MEPANSTPEAVEVQACTECSEVVEEAVKLYECGQCGTTFSRENSADGDSSRCPDCNKFSGLKTESGCPECEDGDVESATRYKCPADGCEELHEESEDAAACCAEDAPEPAAREASKPAPPADGWLPHYCKESELQSANAPLPSSPAAAKP